MAPVIRWAAALFAIMLCVGAVNAQDTIGGRLLHKHAATQQPAQATPVCNIKHCFNTKDPRFGTQGWCHKELHACGYIDQMFEQTKNKCCDGPQSDECGIGLVDIQNNKVYYGGTWHELNSAGTGYEVPRAVIDGIPPGLGIVCGRNGSTYCISIDGGS